MKAKTRFIADCNVGKLARRLRMMGYDTLFFRDIDDDLLIEHALAEDRVLVTRDTELAKRKIATNGQLRIVLVQYDDPKEQLQHVLSELKLEPPSAEFTRCLECNGELVPRAKEDVQDLVPPYVLRTQTQYMQCPGCTRVYWRGTHWKRM